MNKTAFMIGYMKTAGIMHNRPPKPPPVTEQDVWNNLEKLKQIILKSQGGSFAPEPKPNWDVINKGMASSDDLDTAIEGLARAGEKVKRWIPKV